MGSRRPKSLEHRAKISAALKGKKKSPEQIAKMSANAKRQGFGGAREMTPEVRAKISAKLLGKSYPKGPDRSKFSEAAIRRLQSGEAFRVKGHFPSTKSSKSKVPFRSELEHQVMEMLETSQSVKYWEYELTRVWYTDDDRVRLTLVDFSVELVSGKQLLVEAKATGLLDSFTKKWYALIFWASYNDMEFVVVTESSLDSLRRKLDCT